MISFRQLPPAENGVGAQRIKPGEEAEVAALFAVPQAGAEGAVRFGGVAAAFDRFVNVRGEFFVDFASQAAGVKNW